MMTHNYLPPRPAGRRCIALSLLAVLLLVSACAAQPAPESAQPVFTDTPQPAAPGARAAGPVANPAPISEPAPDRVIETAPDVVERPRDRSVRVAILLPLSGRAAGVGQSMFNAAQLALFQLADDNFSLLPFDTKGTPEGAIAATEAALAQNAELILGPLFSGSVGAIRPLVEAGTVNVISFTTDWRQAGGPVHVMGFLPFSQVNRVVAYARARGMERLGILAPDGIYGDAVVEAAGDALREHGGTLTKLSRYDPAAEDLRPVVEEFTDFAQREAALEQVRAELAGREDEASRRALRELRTLDTFGEPPFDAALIAEGGDRLAVIAPLLPFFDINSQQVKFLGTGLWDDPQSLREPALTGAWFASASRTRRADFERDFRDSFGQPPTRLASLAFDAVALAAVLARQDVDFFTNDVQIREAALTSRLYNLDVLRNPNGFSGVDGIFRFRDTGLVERGLSIIEIGEEDFVEIDPAPGTFVQPGT